MISSSGFESSIVAMQMGGAMNAISASPDWSHIAVAGRDVLKIVRIGESDGTTGATQGYPLELEVVQNLRTGKMNLNYSR
jgi:hypothetical protein